MINFEYGSYSFEYNEFQHKLEVKCDDGELLLDAHNFNLGEMNEIYEHLNNYFNFKYHVDKLREVIDELRDKYVHPLKNEETEEVYEFLLTQEYIELDVLNTLLGGYKDDEE